MLRLSLALGPGLGTPLELYRDVLAQSAHSLSQFPNVEDN